MIRRPARPVPPAMPAAVPADPVFDEPAAPDTVRFAAPGEPVTPAVVAPPTAAQSLAKIELRLGELVRLARLTMGLGAAWLLWTVFGGGVAWVVSAATWAVGIVFGTLLVLGLAAYFSPRFRRVLWTGGVRAGRWAAAKSAARQP